MFKIKKIDKRYSGGKWFKYIATPKPRVNFTSYFPPSTRADEERQFIEMRNWCWNQWGPSTELRFYNHDWHREWINPVWAWETEYDKLRIYFETDKEAAWFQLKWS